MTLPKPRPHHHPWLTLAALLAAAAALPAGVRAQDDLIDPTPITRKFPQGQFCTLPVELSFIANGPAATIAYEANVYTDDGAGGLLWTNQSIDNAVIATDTDYAANFGPPPEFSSSQNCYIGDPQPTPYFYFNRAGLVLPLLERFDNDPGPRGWDLAQGAYFQDSNTGPRNPEADDDYTGGSLGLGLESPNPSLADRARTSITVGGLTNGQRYFLTTWWDCGNVVLNGATYLTIRITGSGATPLAQKSWGAVKRRYR